MSKGTDYRTQCKNPEYCNLLSHDVHGLMEFWRQRTQARKHELCCNQVLHYCITPWRKTLMKLFRAGQVYLFIFSHVTRRFIAALTTVSTKKFCVFVTCIERKLVGILAETQSVMTRCYVAFPRPSRKMSEQNIHCRIDHDRFHILSSLSVNIHLTTKLAWFLQRCE